MQYLKCMVALMDSGLVYSFKWTDEDHADWFEGETSNTQTKTEK